MFPPKDDHDLLNNNEKPRYGSKTDGGTFGRDNQEIVDMLRNDTLDVLECDDFKRVISDCTEDCVNIMTDYLEQMFPVRPNKTMKNGKCKFSKQESISKDVSNDKGDDDTVSKKVDTEKGLSSLEHAHTDEYVSSLFIMRSCCNIKIIIDIIV